MKELIDTCTSHNYVYLNRERYRSENKKEFILEIYCCVDCGTGMSVYIPKEEFETPKERKKENNGN